MLCAGLYDLAQHHNLVSTCLVRNTALRFVHSLPKHSREDIQLFHLQRTTADPGITIWVRRKALLGLPSSIQGCLGKRRTPPPRTVVYEDLPAMALALLLLEGMRFKRLRDGTFSVVMLHRVLCACRALGATTFMDQLIRAVSVEGPPTNLPLEHGLARHMHPDLWAKRQCQLHQIDLKSMSCKGP